MNPENIKNSSGRCPVSNSEADLKNRLKTLPQVKANPDFDRKMAALFSLELESEIQRINQSWLRKSGKIRLPELITDLRAELF
jgi:hypothetical protein